MTQKWPLVRYFECAARCVLLSFLGRTRTPHQGRVMAKRLPPFAAGSTSPDGAFRGLLLRRTVQGRQGKAVGLHGAGGFAVFDINQSAGTIPRLDYKSAS
jgi:hypothetical protein